MNVAAAEAPIPVAVGTGVARRSLLWRVLLLVAIGMGAILGAFSASSLLAVNGSKDRMLEERRNLAEVTAGHVDYVVQQSLKSLDDVSFAEGFDLEDESLVAEQQALRRAYFGSIFSAGVYLTDGTGRVIVAEPSWADRTGVSIAERPYVRVSLATGRPGVSGTIVSALDQGPAVSMVVPLKNRSGQIVGLLGGDIRVNDGQLSTIIRPSAVGETSYVQIVDDSGSILASTQLAQVLQQSDHADQMASLIRSRQSASRGCHSCHERATGSGQNQGREVMAFAPVKSAPWGVLIRQAQDEALAPSEQLTQRAIWLGVPAFAVALLFAWATVRSIVRPVSALRLTADRLASGDLSQPVPAMGKDEIGGLARAFESMRVRLKYALETVEGWAGELEQRVHDRTHELEVSRDHLRAVAEENASLYEELKQKEAARADLLGKVIGAQEDERRRIARELHDETSQALTVLVMGMETAVSGPQQEHGPLREKLAGLRDLAVHTLEGVHRLIYDLRPSVLDDLGLVPGLRWYGERRLEPCGIRLSLLVTGSERRLPAEIETALFRIAQEAISNVAQHSRATDAFVGVSFLDDRVVLEVEDDGQGFDVSPLNAATSRKRGWGLLGMQERASLLGGTLEIDSAPANGTRLRVVIPLRGGST